jgi:hypothetical protein
MEHGFRRVVRSIAALAGAMLLCAAARAQAAQQVPPRLFEYPVTFEAGYARDDNANRGRDSELQLADDVFSLTFSQPREWRLEKRLRLEVTGIVAGDKFGRYSGLDRFSVGVQALLQYRGSGAFDATTWSLAGRAAYDEYGSHLRSGARYFLGVNGQHAFTDRLELFAEAGRNERYGHSDVFNLRDDSVLATLVYTLDDRNLFYLTGRYRRGDAVSTGGPSLVNADIAEVLVPDDAFGQPLISYRFRARTALWTLGWNHSLGPRDGIDVSWRRVETVPLAHPQVDFRGDLRYTANEYAIVYLRRF